MKYLIRPFDQLIIRKNPIYDDGVFILEKLNKDLSLYKEYHNGEAEEVEDFFEELKVNKSLHQKNKTIFKHVNKPGWVLIETEDVMGMNNLWKLAMAKVRKQDFYRNGSKNTVSRVTDIEAMNIKIKLYINDNSGVLAVMSINGYPKVLRGINHKEELTDTWSSIEINGNQYDVNIFNEDKASIYGLNRTNTIAGVTTNTSTFLALPVEIITSKNKTEHANRPQKIPRV